ncbi:MAG: hypothetical protein TE42_09790 [Candidatus Synechococcus spongiarum SP3]|uniref:Uncharacterized protein n=1 Tax=Candidatus Synechococcus spongiarum SP3 TaxID=1604020 RepID=A0A0G2J431_9SYNE|nr:MAG: hypothetical protein TE42_09790 [Candidatus Synechococcus spongiarum SP3]
MLKTGLGGAMFSTMLTVKERLAVPSPLPSLAVTVMVAVAPTKIPTGPLTFSVQGAAGDVG